MQEATYQRRLIKKLQVLFPGCVVVKNDPSENQGIPDILILFRNMWAMLEVKVSPVAPEQPNQVYWVDAYNEMSFAASILKMKSRCYMIFNRHSELQGKHAFLSPSNYAWLNYTDQKLESRYYSVMAARRGSDIHALAHEAIRLGIKLSRANQALSTYVNDAIGFKMVCEQGLFFSENCFGTADTICFRRNKLRIHDLKTGITATSEKQLEVYAALFCLEYGIDPFEIDIELRIYQRDEIRVFEPPPEQIVRIMERIIDFDQQIEAIKEAR